MLYPQIALSNVLKSFLFFFLNILCYLVCLFVFPSSFSQPLIHSCFLYILELLGLIRGASFESLSLCSLFSFSEKITGLLHYFHLFKARITGFCLKVSQSSYVSNIPSLVSSPYFMKQTLMAVPHPSDQVSLML